MSPSASNEEIQVLSFDELSSCAAGNMIAIRLAWRAGKAIGKAIYSRYDTQILDAIEAVFPIGSDQE
jgi:hypothetical protein